MNPLAARQAAILLAVDPLGLGGVRLRDRHGPRRDAWLAWLAAALPPGRPWRRLPAGTDDARWLGGLDLGASLQAGRPVAQRGLLAECDGGLLLVPMAERLGAARAGQLGAVLDRHEVHVQREGLDQRLPARLAVAALDEGTGDDETTPTALAERLGLWVDLAACGEALPAPDAGLAAAAQRARERLPSVRCPDALLQALAHTAATLGVDSDRALLFASRAARAAAAWAGRDEVDDDDAAWAARLVLAPRARCLPALPPADGDEASAASCADAPAAATDSADRAGGDDLADPPASTPPRDDPHEAGATKDATVEQASWVLQAALAALPPGLLARLASARVRGHARSAGSAGSWQANASRGRPAGSHTGDPRRGARLNLVDTLRAAAPWQALRRAERAAAHAATASQPLVDLRREDFRVVRCLQRRETLTVFVVDASGSSALHRLAEAKGAVELLLADCYVRRDRVALVAFRSQPGVPQAELLLPPTRSLARARRGLAALAGGGGTPLAVGLDAAWQLAHEHARRGATPVVVVLSDGRANIARDGSPGRARAGEDALASARAFAGSGLDLLWLDTAPQPQPQARHLADAMGARYLPLPHADAHQLRAAVA